jgi:hypothetical protein
MGKAKRCPPWRVLGLVGWALGIDPRVLIGGAETMSKDWHEVQDRSISESA